ncbi:ABC transporter permease [Streptomyces laurentii]|uniref:ABC transporter permease n=1 Tax=Streptomyces laurentii TaxID=39478 RepID=UPI00367B0987
MSAGTLPQSPADGRGPASAPSLAKQPSSRAGSGSGPGPGSGTRADDGRIGLRANLRHIGALARRNMLQIKQDPESMFDAVFMPIVFVLLFVYVFGGAIAGKGNNDAYVNYVVPGLMAMMGMNIAMGVGTGINDDFKKGVMDRFRTMPIARSSVLIAKIVVEIGRMLIATAILLGMGFLLGLQIHTSVLGLFGAIGLSMVFGASLMWIFILLGLTMQTAQAVQGMAMIVLMPLQFGSSIFAPPTTMPGWLQAFTDYNPLSALADSSRALINGGPLAHSVWMTLGWSVAITAVMAPLAVAKFRKKT